MKALLPTDKIVRLIIKDAKSVNFESDDDKFRSYLLTYPEFIRYFQKLPVIRCHNLIIAANFTYGWIPSITEFRKFQRKDFKEATTILNRVKAGNHVNEENVKTLQALIDNSLIAVSKLLHFVNPNFYGIWDTNVSQYLTGSNSKSVKLYLQWLDVCQDLIKRPAIRGVVAAVNNELGYKVTPIRAIELVMFHKKMGGRR